MTLVNGKNPVVYQEIATHLNTPVEVLQLLAKSKDPRIRKRVALNPNTPQDVCQSIYNDLVQQDEVDEEFTIRFVQKNILAETEVLALISLYGESVATAVAESIPVARGSLLSKVLARYNLTPEKELVEKDNVLERN